MERVYTLIRSNDLIRRGGFWLAVRFGEYLESEHLALWEFLGWAFIVSSPGTIKTVEGKAFNCQDLVPPLDMPKKEA